MCPVSPQCRIAIAALCCSASFAWAQEIASACDSNLQARIEVRFHDREVLTDGRLTVTELNRIAGSREENHNVYGLTYANPDLKMKVRPLVADAGNATCAVPDISIDLGFSDFRVYLAKELMDPCQQAIIRQHEEEHVSTWRSQLRASAQLLTAALRNEAGPPREYANRAQAEAGVNQWSIELVTPWMKRLLAGVRSAQAAIDTQVSYDIVQSRLRTCGQAVRGGSR